MLQDTTRLENLIQDLRALLDRADTLQVEGLTASLQAALATLENERRLETRKRA
jgi:hypothetical protein